MIIFIYIECSLEKKKNIYSQDKRGNKAREKRCHWCNGDFTEWLEENWSVEVVFRFEVGHPALEIVGENDDEEADENSVVDEVVFGSCFVGRMLIFFFHIVIAVCIVCSRQR